MSGAGVDMRVDLLVTLPNNGRANGRTFEDLTPEPIVLPPRQADQGYVRPPITDQTFVPQVYLPESKGEDKD